MSFLEEYTLLDELGRGGFATVYKVRHNKFGYIRAVRVLNAVIANGEDDELYQKFIEECRLLLRLGNGSHPNIVHIYQPLLRAQRAIVEMDYIDGLDLYHYLEKKSSFVETDEVIRLLLDIGGALAYCHEDIYKFCMGKDEDELKDDPNDGSKVLIDESTRQRLIKKYGIIHNDLHSGNIIHREDGSYVLLDFGLAIDGNSIVRSSRRRNGAPEFKAPEKWDNNGILTTQSDIYSFGVILYEFLAGRVPFPFDYQNSNPIEAEYLLSKAHKENLPESIYALRKEAFERTHPGEEYKHDYPQWLENVIVKCLAKNPADRYKNGKELHNEVKNLIANKGNNTATPSIVESGNNWPELDNDDKGQQGNNNDNSLPQNDNPSPDIDTGGIDIVLSNNKKWLFVICGIVAIIIAFLAIHFDWFKNSNEPKEKSILAQQIVVSEQEYTLKVGESKKITVTILPANTTDTVIIWTISNSLIASIDNGNVTAKDEGQAIITATTKESNVSTSAILVVESSKDSAMPKNSNNNSSSNSKSGITTNYTAGGSTRDIAVDQLSPSPKPIIIIPNDLQNALNILINQSLPSSARLDCVLRIMDMFFEPSAKVVIGNEIKEYKNVKDYFREIVINPKILGFEILWQNKNEKIYEIGVLEVRK